MITGIRGLCNGLGPALYGFVFYLFHVELTDLDAVDGADKGAKPNMANPTDEVSPPLGGPRLGHAPRARLKPVVCSSRSRGSVLTCVLFTCEKVQEWRWF